LEGMLKERDVQIAYLFHRCSYLDEAASYVPLLDQLSQCLKSSIAAPPPKVQTVKAIRNSVSTGHDYTPDVPSAPSNDKPALKQPQTAASAALADHFAHPPQKQKPPPQQQHQQQQQHQHQNAHPMPDYPHYQEAVASLYAANPSVALNHKMNKKIMIFLMTTQ